MPLINKASLTFLERHKKRFIAKTEKDSRKFNDHKTSLQTKRVCEDLERMAIVKKQKIEKIHKEPCQSDCQLSSTTETDATIEESKNKIYVIFKKIFSDIKTEQIHNYYFCQQRNCRHISL